MARSFFEDLAELGFTLAIKLSHDLRAVEMNEVHATLSRYSARQQGLACAWSGHRAARPSGREFPAARTDASSRKRQLHHFAHSALLHAPGPRCLRKTLRERATAVDSPSTMRMSVRFPITTGPEGIVRTTWKFTALANVGTRTTQPAMHRDAQQIFEHAARVRPVAGAAPHPQRREANRYRLLVLDRARPSPAPAILRRNCCGWCRRSESCLLVHRWKAARANRQSMPVIFSISPPVLPCAQIGGRNPRDRMSNVSRRRLRKPAA